MTEVKLHHQVVGNAGLYYVCYQLSLRGWNAMPTARNARGVDAVIYSQDALQSATVQIKALSKRNPVPLGGSLDRLFGDWFIVVCNVTAKEPRSFVLTPAEVRSLAQQHEKNGKTSIWLQPPHYDRDEYREAWHRIGSGLPSTPTMSASVP